MKIVGVFSLQSSFKKRRPFWNTRMTRLCFGSTDFAEKEPSNLPKKLTRTYEIPYDETLKPFFVKALRLLNLPVMFR